MKLCIECGDKPACHWNRSLCESCLSEMLSEKVKKDDDK